MARKIGDGISGKELLDALKSDLQGLHGETNFMEIEKGCVLGLGKEDFREGYGVGESQEPGDRQRRFQLFCHSP